MLVTGLLKVVSFWFFGGFVFVFVFLTWPTSPEVVTVRSFTESWADSARWAPMLGVPVHSPLQLRVTAASRLGMTSSATPSPWATARISVESVPRGGHVGS